MTDIDANIRTWRRIQGCKGRFDAADKAMDWLRASANFSDTGIKSYAQAMNLGGGATLDGAISPALIVGVACQESSFGTSLGSSSRYKGVFQISEDVVKDFNRFNRTAQAQFPGDIDGLNDIETAAKVASWYLARIVQSFTFKDTDTQLARITDVGEARKFALAAYNGGGQVIKQARLATPATDREKWSEVSKFLGHTSVGITQAKVREIRDYVANIQGYMARSAQCWCDECAQSIASVLNFTGIKVVINRLSDNGVQTIGDLTVVDGHRDIHRCKTLELPWRDNEQKTSCIPTGIYQVSKRTTTKHGQHFHIKNVPNKREWILIHKGNYYYDIEGCILVGDGLKYLDSDGQLDVTNSGVQMDILNTLLPNNFTLELK